MGFSLDDYINGKKKKEEQAGQKPTYFQFGQQPKAVTSPSVSPKAMTPTSSPAGGGSGFSLDNYIITKGIRTGQLQQQDNDFNSWLEDVQSFSKRMSGDFTRRQGTYQAPDTFRAYQGKTGTEISELLKRAYTAQNYYTQYGKTYDEVYGAGSTAKLLDGVKQNIDYLEGLRKDLQSEQEWWGQFQDEATFDLYKRYKGYEDLRQAADFGEKSQYRTTKNGKEAKQSFSGIFTETGYNDLLYDFINGDEEARARQAAVDVTAGGFGSLYTDTHSGWSDLPEEVVKTFNYIYATEGKDAAYEYMNLMADQGITGINSLALNFVNASGAFSMAALAEKGLNTLFGKGDAPSAFYGDILHDLARAQEQHPTASAVGSVGGNLALLYGTGATLGAAEGALATGIKIGGKTVAVQMAPAVQGVVNSSLSFLAADAVRNAGALAAGHMEPVDYLKSAGISGAQGLAGGLAGGLVGSGMAKVLRETGMMTPFMEFVRQSTSGFASAGANIGTGYLLSEEKPSNEQIATDLATAFLFSVIQGGISTYKTTQATKAQMNAALDEITRRYGQMSQSWETMTPEARAEAANYIMEQTQSLRNSLNSQYLAGQQATVDQLNQALDALTQGMQGYINGFQAYQAATTAPGNMLGGGAASGGAGLSPTFPGPSGGGEIAELQTQLQTAISQGIQQTPASTPAGILPAGAVNALSGSTGIAPLDKAIQALTSGGAVSNSMAQAILDTPEAISVLEQAAQLSISGQEPIKDQRNAVKTAVGSLARPAGGAPRPTGTTTPPATGVMQKGPESAIQRTEAIMVRDRMKVEQFSSTLGKAGGGVMKEMYDPSVPAEAYLPAMSDYYNAGKQGTDMSLVYEKAGNVVTPQQAQAAYLAGQADMERGSVSGVEKMEEVQGYEQGQGEVRLRDGSEWGDGAHPGIPVQELESGAGQDQSGDIQGGPADAGAASLAHGEKVTTASLGIGGGSSSDSIYLVTGGDTAATAAAKEIAKERGVRLTLFVGGNLTISPGDGQVASVRGCISGDRAFIRADHPEYTAEQFMRHEAGHDMIAKGEIDPEAVRERINREMGAEKVEQLSGVYEAAYRGSGLTAEEVWEEVICDSLGDMNIFSGTVHEDAAKELLEPTKKAASTERGVPRTRGPPAKNAASREKGKFSMETPIEETEDLIALHNLTEEKLLKALDLGGFPMPSIAVTKADIPHTNFGDITLVMDKTTVDPEFDRRNMVYSADAWTPTFPTTEYEVNEKVAAKLRSKYYELYRAHGRDAVDALYPWGNYAEDQLNREGGEAEAISKLQEDTGMMKVYLTDRGQQVPAPVIEEAVTRMDDGSIALSEHLISALGEDLVRSATSGARPPMLWWKEWAADHGDALESAYRSFLKEHGFSEEQIETVMDAKELRHILTDARKYLISGPETRTTRENFAATQKAIRDAVDQDAYHEWLNDLFGGIEKSSGIYNGKDRYTPSGDLRSFKATHIPVTLENITKAMVSEGKGDNRNVSGFYGVKSLRASTAARFSSIKNMHELEGRLQHLTEEEAQAINDELHNRLFALMERVYNTKPHSQYSNQLMDMDAIGEMLMDAARADKITIDGIIKEFSGSGYKISTPLATELRDLFFDISQMPVNIFEAKPERSVRFDEVLAAIIPDTSSDKLRSGLEGVGVKVMEYPAGDDDARLEKANSVEGAKFSRELESIESLRRENEELKSSLEEFKGIAKTAERRAAQAAYWKGQTKRTTPETLTVRQGDVAKLAKDLTIGWDSTIAPKEITQDLTELGEYLLRGEDGTGEIDTHKVWDMAHAIGKQLVESAQALTNDLYEEYADLRAYVREASFTISETDSHDIADYGDFLRRNFGRFRVKKGPSNIDQLYKEMSDKWPGFFDGKRENAAGDMLLRIEEVLNQLTPIYDNPYSYDMANAIQAATEAVLDGVMGESVRQQAPTFADRQARKLEAAIAKGKQAVAREREKRTAQVQRVKDHYADMRQRQSERRADSKARTRLLNIAKRMNNKKLPAANRALLDQYIGDLDLAAKSMTGRTLEKLTDLRDWYNGITTEGSDTYDPDFIPDEATKRKLERLSKRQINNLTPQEVADLTEALLNIENELRTAKKLIDTQERRDISQMGREVIRDLEEIGGSKAAGPAGALDRLLVTETLSPVRQLRRMVGYIDSDPLLRLTEGLADGQRAMLDYQMRAEKPFEKYASDDTFSQNFSGRKADAIKVVGLTKDGPVEVTITPAMRASLYLHSLNDQNLRHIKEGGITVPDEKLYRAGKIAEAYARGKTVKLTPSQVRAICAGMTAQEKAYAAEAERYFNGTSPEAINTVSEKLKGYPIAQVEHYFPINTDTSFTKADFEAIKKDGSIEGMGWTKERINAATPILLRDLDAVLTQSIRQHSKYVGLAIPVRNFQKVWTVTTASYNDDGSRNSYEASVQSAVKRAWGEAGYRYIEKMMADLQGSTQPKNEWAKQLAKVRSNYAGAVLTLNASVAMKQAASYPTAAAVLGWKPLLRAMADNGRVNLDLIAKYTPLQWYRSKGFSTKELGDISASNSSRFKVFDWMRGKDLPTFLNWVQGIDLLTTRKLWKASEYYIRDTRRDLGVGTDDYYKAVADVYNRVIEETQPNYTTMQRPQLLRSEDSLMANLAMFKTQPFQNFNILYDAANNWAAKAKRAQGGGAEQQAEEKTARRDFGRAVTSQLAQLAVFAAMTAAWAFFRGKTSKYEDEDTGEVTTASFLSAFSKDMAGGLLSSVPFGSDAWEALSSKMFGDAYYGMDVTTVSAITDTIQSFDGLTDLVGSIFQSVTSGQEVNWNSARLKLDGYLDDISKAAGVPYENVANLFNAAYRQACIAAMGEYRGKYAALKLTTDPEKYRADYYDLLYKALQGDRAAYEAIYEDMVSSGTFEAEKVRNAMEKRMKDAQGVEKASELEQRYLSPEQEKVYDRVLGEITGSSVWRSATPEQRNKLEEGLYDLTVENGTGAKLQEKIDGGAAYGIDEADYLLFRLALDLVDQPTESGKTGSYTNDEVEAAIEMLSGLSDEARSYLWSSQGKSDKSNPWG